MRTDRARYPTASNRPTSPARCSTPRPNSRPTSRAEETIRKKLKPTNSPAKSVAPRAAASPCSLSGVKRNPKESSGSDSNSAARKRSRVVSRSAPDAAPTRTEVVLPYRVLHSRRPVSAETNALGVAPWRSQYASSFGRIRPRSTGKGGSQPAMSPAS